MFEIVNLSLIVSVLKHIEEQPKQDDYYSLADDEDYIQELDHSIKGQMNLGSMSEREALDQQVSSDSKMRLLVSHPGMKCSPRHQQPQLRPKLRP